MYFKASKLSAVGINSKKRQSMSNVGILIKVKVHRIPQELTPPLSDAISLESISR